MDSRAKLAIEMANMAKSMERLIPKVMGDFQKQMAKDTESAKMFEDAIKEVDLTGKVNELSKVQKDAENFLKKYNAGKGK